MTRSQGAPLRAMVLAAGEGRRLRPLTVFRAKPAMPLLGASPLEFAVERLRAAQIHEVVVNLHHQPQSIEQVLARRDWGENFVLHYSREAEILGTAGGLKQAEEWLSGGTFLVLNGDTILDTDLTALVAWHRKCSAAATLLLRPKPAGSRYTGFTLAEEGRIVSMGRTPEAPSSLMFAGVWVLEPTVFRRLAAGRFARMEVDLLPELILEGSAFGYVADDPWFDIGTPERYLHACQEMARRGIFREAWRVQSIASQPQARAGSMVLAETGSFVDPTAQFTGISILGGNCRVERGAHLRGAVLWDGVTVGEGALVRDSVIANDVSVAPGGRIVNQVIARLRPGQGADRASLRAREILGDCVVAPIKS